MHIFYNAFAWEERKALFVWQALVSNPTTMLVLVVFVVRPSWICSFLNLYLLESRESFICGEVAQEANGPIAWKQQESYIKRFCAT